MCGGRSRSLLRRATIPRRSPGSAKHATCPMCSSRGKRAALRQRNWREVLAAIDAMTDKEREQSAWRYWKARAFKAAGREEEATALLKPLAREYSFYGQLALEELGERISTPPAAFKPTAADVRAMSENLSVRRALELYRLNLRVDATREWIWAIRSFDDRQLLTAAEVARRYELYDRAINTADKTESLHDFSLRYLAPYRDVLKVRVKEMNLDEAWVYGLIRQESRFIVDARSRVGARRASCSSCPRRRNGSRGKWACERSAM